MHSAMRGPADPSQGKLTVLLDGMVHPRWGASFDTIVGPSGVRALPVAAGTNVVAPIVGIFFLLSSLFSLRPLLFYHKDSS